ncbi:SDR family oxidoreductase [Luteimonas rhizosphaerae]|uniref:SDR family oxidoreductase n=1 Tax=Luteimonas sp. 4-12 TaxID=2027406 RepID=UPI000C7A2A0A|nr:SDR family oxidoreductase [Luteimonas sp. 4-12]
MSTSATNASPSQVQPKRDWTLADMPSQRGRIVLVTGGTSGIGYESAKALAAAGAQVVIAARDPKRGAAAIAEIRQVTPTADVRFEALDLADLASVRAFGQRIQRTLPRLDVLINNAGLMEPPTRGVSADGFEIQFAVNYLGHFALTSALLPLLRQADAPRVVTLSSIAARGGSLHFDDLQFKTRYDARKAYSQSKLACLMFAFELQRRSDAAGWGIQSMASHPGVSRTDLLVHHGGANGFARRQFAFLFQPAMQGALSPLYAATAEAAQGGAYYGPTRLMETRGAVGIAKVPDAARDTDDAAHLWTISESLARVRFATAAR